jgi:two-component system, NarL family, response regulator DevR
MAEGGTSVFSKLSTQERQILLLISQGRTNREIAKTLFLEEGTIRNYVSNILAKLNMNNRTEAAAYAREHKLKEYKPG